LTQKKNRAQLWAEYILAYSVMAALRFLPLAAA